MATATKLVTYEEWLRMPVVQDSIEEVVNGEIRIMPPNKLPHVFTVEELADIIRPRIDRKKIKLLITNFGLVIRRDPLTSRVPDLILYTVENAVWIDGYLHSAPELAVEVLSPSETRGERLDKLADYSSIGVPEVWFLSPEAQTVEIFHPVDGKLQSVQILTSGVISPLRFPQVKIGIEQIWPGSLTNP
jgi:Uma2 family endonuclease